MNNDDVNNIDPVLTNTVSSSGVYIPPDKRTPTQKLRDENQRLLEQLAVARKEIESLKEECRLPFSDKNIAWYPEEVGAEVICKLGDDGGYDWGVLYLFKDKISRRLFWFDEGGCSCYGISDWHSLKEMDELTEESWEKFETAVISGLSRCYASDDERVACLELAKKNLKTLKEGENDEAWI